MKEKLYIGKPMSHWEAMAEELVVDILVRASLQMDVRSIPGKIAGDHLMHLAKSRSTTLVEKVLDERNRFQQGMAMVLIDITGDGKRKLNGKGKGTRSPCRKGASRRRAGNRPR